MDSYDLKCSETQDLVLDVLANELNCNIAVVNSAGETKINKVGNNTKNNIVLAVTENGDMLS